MTSTNDLLEDSCLSATRDGFDLLDTCHIQTALTLGKLAALVTRLASSGPDREAQAIAAEIVRFFSATSREHHEDEERHVFPKLLSGGNAEIVQDVLRLQQDHAWLEQDWMELAPQVDAVACGQGWYDLDTLREGAEIFSALSRDHMALEESIIYPKARTRQLVPERQEMRREMTARRKAHRSAALASGGVGTDRNQVSQPTDRRTDDHEDDRGGQREPSSCADPVRLGEGEVRPEILGPTQDQDQSAIAPRPSAPVDTNEALSGTLHGHTVLEGGHAAGPGTARVRYRVQYESIGNVVHYQATFSDGKSRFPYEGQFDFEPSRIDAATAVDAFMQNHLSKTGWDVSP